MIESEKDTQIKIMAIDQAHIEKTDAPINLKIEGIDAQVRKAIPELSSFGACNFLFKIALPITVVLGVSMVIAESNAPGTMTRVYQDLYNAFVWLKYKIM